MSEYRVTIKGLAPLIMHDVIGGMNENSPAKKEIKGITAKRGNQRTDTDNERLRELETLTSLWYNIAGQIAIPERAIRSMLEASAKTKKEGPMVRQGLIVLSTEFEYDYEKYGRTEEELALTAQFTIPVRVGQSTVNRTRAKIDEPWECTFVVDLDDELADQSFLEEWLRIGGRRMGLGDWRPAKSGSYGRFETVKVEAL